jgi:hypothetical protein
MQHGSDFLIPALAALGGTMVAVVASYLGGFLGIGLAGLFAGFAAVSYDLRKDDVGGGFPSANLYARQLDVREQRSADERLAHRASVTALRDPLAIARTISVGLIAVGFGGYFFL